MVGGVHDDPQRKEHGKIASSLGKAMTWLPTRFAKPKKRKFHRLKTLTPERNLVVTRPVGDGDETMFRGGRYLLDSKNPKGGALPRLGKKQFALGVGRGGETRNKKHECSMPSCNNRKRKREKGESGGPHESVTQIN